MIRMDLINNNKVTTDDVNLSTNAYGPYVGEIKEKLREVGQRPLLET